MDANVHVVPRAQYDQFIRQREANGSSAVLGHEEWTGACTTCHRLDHPYVGPALGGNALLGDRKGIETLLRDGRGLMPAVGKNWTDAQIDALVAYTKQFAKAGAQ
jgi:mono/diheme cytochrome c family protein